MRFQPLHQVLNGAKAPSVGLNLFSKERHGRMIFVTLRGKYPYFCVQSVIQGSESTMLCLVRGYVILHHLIMIKCHCHGDLYPVVSSSSDTSSVSQMKRF